MTDENQTTATEPEAGVPAEVTEAPIEAPVEALVEATVEAPAKAAPKASKVSKAKATATEATEGEDLGVLTQMAPGYSYFIKG